MKLSTIVFGAAMAAEPIDYLNTIKTAAHEILSHEDVTPRSNKWVSVWEGKFDRTIDRMERNFQRRCGSYDANTAPVSADFEYDTSNPCAGMKKVLNEFSNWSNRHLAGCNGQINHNHHGKRMTRWAKYFESALNCSQPAEPIIAAVAKLDGQCFFKRSGDYDFKVCPFDSITQHHLYSSSSYDLGDWNGVNSIAKQGDNLSFVDGAGPCPNGRYRQSKVNFTCGSSTGITRASEPSMCYYVFDMTVNCDGESSRTTGRTDFLPLIANSTVV